MEIRWLRGAIASFNREIDYIAAESVSRLSAFPESGRPGRIAGTRELVIPGTSYIVPYRVAVGRIEIIRVFHAMRRWPDAF